MFSRAADQLSSNPLRFSIKEEEEKKSSINNIIIMGSYEDAKRKAHVMKFKKYIKSLSKPQKVGLILTLCSFVLLLLYLVIDNHDTLFIMAEFVHFIGIAILAYKLLREKSCLGLSMQTQELTAIFLGIRLYCSFMMEYDWHTILDFLTLMATMWVLSTMKGSLKHNYETHNRPLDTIMTWQVLVPCVIMAIIAHPANVARGCESSVVGHVRVFGSGERFAAVARDAIGESCGEMDGELRVFFRCGEVFELRALDFTDFRRTELLENRVDDRIVASHGFGLRDCADVHFGRFLLFLRLVFCGWWQGCAITSWISIIYKRKKRDEKRRECVPQKRSENTT